MGCTWIGWCALGAEAQAAWVQAIGSVVAIALAVAVPAYQHWSATRKERRQLDLRARSLGLAILADLETVGSRLNGIWDFEHPDALPDIQDHANTKQLGEKTILALELPNGLNNRLDVLHEMGAAGDAALRCVHHIIRAREYVTTLPGGIKVTFDSDRFYDLLWDATGQLVVALNRVDAQFPAPKRPRN